MRVIAHLPDDNAEISPEYEQKVQSSDEIGTYRISLTCELRISTMKILLFFVVLILISHHTPESGMSCAHVLSIRAITKKDVCIDPCRSYRMSYRWCNISEEEMNLTGGDYGTCNKRI